VRFGEKVKKQRAATQEAQRTRGPYELLHKSGRSDDIREVSEYIGKMPTFIG
jgi:hypothetical protein